MQSFLVTFKIKHRLIVLTYTAVYKYSYLLTYLLLDVVRFTKVLTYLLTYLLLDVVRFTNVLT